MADVKISAMPAAAEVANADICPWVQAGLNVRATKEQVFTGSAGEDFWMTGVAGQFCGILNSATTGGIYVNGVDEPVIAGDQVLIAWAGGTPHSIAFQNTGDVLWEMGDGGVLTIDSETTSQAFTLNMAANTCTIQFDIVLINFVAAVAGDWSGASPTDIWAAIDRCAALLKVLNGGVGP